MKVIALERLAGLAYIAPVVAGIATWYLLLFGPGLPGEHAGASLRGLLVDDAQRHVFWWLALLTWHWLDASLALSVTLPLAASVPGAIRRLA